MPCSILSICFLAFFLRDSYLPTSASLLYTKTDFVTRSFPVPASFPDSCLLPSSMPRTCFSYHCVLRWEAATLIKTGCIVPLCKIVSGGLYMCAWQYLQHRQLCVCVCVVLQEHLHHADVMFQRQLLSFLLHWGQHSGEEDAMISIGFRLPSKMDNVVSQLSFIKIKEMCLCMSCPHLISQLLIVCSCLPLKLKYEILDFTVWKTCF